MNRDLQESDDKQRLRQWVIEHARMPVVGTLNDDTPILEQRIITSLQVMELIVFVEKTCGRPIDVTQLKPAAFRTVNAIYETFFSGKRHVQPAA